MPDPEISAISQALERYSGKYEQEAVEAAIAHREEITPYLIDSLEKVADNPPQFLEDLDYYLYIYALMLLGHFHETRAHQAIVRFFSLPSPILDELVGDIVTEHAPTILYNTSGGDFDLIKSLVLNRQADAYARGEAARALAYAVAAGQLPREEVLSFFSTLFSGEEAGPQSTFWDLIADCILDLQPGELLPIIREADERGLLDGDMVLTEGDFSRALDLSVDHCLERLRQEMAQRSMDDPHRQMLSWSCFRNREREPGLSLPDTNPKRDKKAKKSKKKMAKASKHKNRR
ncbi:MAG: DUF1186 domain-containing protein [Deltaproteobacteria bacterium]|nr:DUF1186 domain-containing protein [Deltaproteobacteria bacterium]